MGVQPIICVTGESGSGKTTLLERLILELSAGGLKVGAVKHVDCELATSPPGKDSARLAAAGARPAIAAGPSDLMVQHAETQRSLLDLAATFCADCDLILAEGYKHSPHDKILMISGDESVGREASMRSPSVRLIVTDRPGRPAGAVGRDDIAAVAEWIRKWLDRRRRLGGAVLGAILVGGLSRRMGSDKAAMRAGGRPVLPRLAELLGGRLEDVWIIGRPVGGVELPKCVRWHLDLRGGCGPLGGIATALRVAGCEGGRAVLAVACDMPALGGEAIDLLLECRRADRPSSALRNPLTGRLEPLAAVYEPHALDRIERALDDGALSVTKLLESLAAHGIDVPAEFADQLANANTPDELDALRAPTDIDSSR